jgi:hypothetical protein
MKNIHEKNGEERGPKWNGQEHVLGFLERVFGRYHLDSHSLQESMYVKFTPDSLRYLF